MLSFYYFPNWFHVPPFYPNKSTWCNARARFILAAMDTRFEQTDLYPALRTYDNGMLDVGDGYNLYWEQSGNPDGQPVLFLHGGPGAGSSPGHRRFFDPQHYRIILFDQRGSGRSAPYARIEANTTQDLINDIERLRQKLNIDKWLIFGGSWGSTLALAYGIAHPEACLGFILRGVFLATQTEKDWFINGISTIFPEAHRHFTEFLPTQEREHLIDSYYARLTDPNPGIHLPAAASWSRYETVCSTLLPGTTARSPLPRPEDIPDDAISSLAIARLEAHYFINSMFLPEGYLLENLSRLEGRPVYIVQGRYDIVCPPVTADRLARHWPDRHNKLTLVIVDDAGHSAMEPGIRRALVRATDTFRDAL